MVTLIVIILILINTIFVSFLFVFTIFLTIVFWLESALLFILCLRTKSCFSLTHLAEFFVSRFFIVFKYFVFLILLVLVLKFFNNGFSLLLPLTVFQVVCIELVFQIIDVCVFFHIYAIETL